MWLGQGNYGQNRHWGKIGLDSICRNVDSSILTCRWTASGAAAPCTCPSRRCWIACWCWWRCLWDRCWLAKMSPSPLTWWPTPATFWPPSSVSWPPLLWAWRWVLSFVVSRTCSFQLLDCYRASNFQTPDTQKLIISAAAVWKTLSHAILWLLIFVCGIIKMFRD